MHVVPFPTWKEGTRPGHERHGGVRAGLRDDKDSALVATATAAATVAATSAATAATGSKA